MYNWTNSLIIVLSSLFSKPPISKDNVLNRESKITPKKQFKYIDIQEFKLNSEYHFFNLISSILQAFCRKRD